MLIFVPMSGFGQRYLRAGFKEPKPLIPVAGRPMIERVLEAFPADARYLFAINRAHAEETSIVQELQRVRPQAKIAIIDPHKDGPVRTVLDVQEHLLAEPGPVILNYCDFGVDWSYPQFERWFTGGGWDGAMTAYRGFHPHSLGPTLYAYMRSEGDRVLEIREKHHFTENKFEEYASSGLYAFKSGPLLVELSRELVARGERVNNEFYVSMLMQVLIERGGKVGVSPLEHFYQWGTPEDLADWSSWSEGMARLDQEFARLQETRMKAALVIPMAGKGERFSKAGYAQSKPLIDVAGAPMVERVLQFLPRSDSTLLVCRDEHARDAGLQQALRRFEPTPRLQALPGVTEGQACTAQIGARELPADRPVLFAPCDAGYVYDAQEWLRREATTRADAILWTAKNHLPAIWRPKMYGWVQAEGNTAVRVATKELVAGVPADQQQVVTGTFWFRSAAQFAVEVQEMIDANERINNEFYLDQLMARMLRKGLKVEVFTVDKFMPWGTPEELKTFDYWNDVFRGGRPLAGGVARQAAAGAQR